MIPSGVTSIGSSTFQGCTKLKSVLIPDSVTSIGDGAFIGCIQTITVAVSDQTWNWLTQNIDSLGLNSSQIFRNYLTTVSFTQATTPVMYAAGKTFVLSAASTSGGKITYSSSNPNVISVAGSTATLKGVGTVTLTASVAAKGNYTAASATRSVTISPITPTLTFTQPTSPIVYATGKTFVLSAASTSGGKITYSSSNPNVISVAGSTATLKGVGTVTLTASVAAKGNYTAASATRSVSVSH